MQESSTVETKRSMGMRAFIIIWIGQVISLLGSAMTVFAVTIWVYQDTGKATALAHKSLPLSWQERCWCPLASLVFC